MLGMTFLSFLVLTVIGAVVAVVYHNVIRYRFLEGNDALFGKLIVGWLGAWLGSPVFGHWFWKIENVYVVPAILGAIKLISCWFTDVPSDLISYKMGRAARITNGL